MTTRSLLVLGAVAIGSSISTLAAATLLRPRPVQAQAVQSSLVLYASHRRDTDKDQGFIFFDQKTGDIWVYDNQNVKEHYRVGQMGQNLEKLK